MTVCIALKLPWSNKINAIPGLHAPEMVVLASDSRFSWQSAGEWYDIGEKIVQFAGNAMLAYAGSVHLAKRVVKGLIEYPTPTHGSRLGPDIWLTGSSALNLVRIVLRREDEALRAEGVSRPARRLQLLLTFADEETKSVRLFRFDTGTQASPYEPFELQGGIWPIGEAEARLHAATRCESILDDRLQHDNRLYHGVVDGLKADIVRQVSEDYNRPTYWTLFPVAGIESAIASERYGTIGGLVQFGIMTINGFFRDVRHASISISPIHEISPPVTTFREGTGWIQMKDGKVVSKTEGKLPF